MVELTIASYNLHWGRSPRPRYRPFDVVAAARVLDADVLVLQESWAPEGGPAQHDQVAEAMGYEVVSQGLARGTSDPKPLIVDRADGAVDRGDGAWSLAVLTRLPVIGSAVTGLPQLRADPVSRAVVRVDVEVDGRPLAVHGTHLAHLQMGVARHRRPLREVLGRADGAAALIGDMNMWGWCLDRMVPPGWRRARGGGATFPSPRPFARIDHLATTGAVEVRSLEVVGDLGSDHLPIRATLVLP